MADIFISLTVVPITCQGHTLKIAIENTLFHILIESIPLSLSKNKLNHFVTYHI